MSEPCVSILLLTHDGAATLPALLAGLGRQRTRFTFETVAVDSGSTDGTLGLLEGRVARLLQVPPRAFNHGGTRNLGVGACRGELVVLLVQDAEPASEYWLSALIEPLLADSTLAGTFARQLPRAHASAVTRHYCQLGMATGEEPRLLSIASQAEFDALTPLERLRRCSFDNVCSCVRRAVWERHPFPQLEIAEDLAWAKAVLLAGSRLAYVPAAAVIHSHDRSAHYELCRTYLVHRQLRLLLGLRTIPTLRHLLRAVATSLVLHVRLERRAVVSQPRRAVRALGLAFAFPLGQYLGALSAETGRRLLRTDGV